MTAAEHDFVRHLRAFRALPGAQRNRVLDVLLAEAYDYPKGALDADEAQQHATALTLAAQLLGSIEGAP